MSPGIQFLKSLNIRDFPSGSSINFHEGKLYLVGDDATNILVLDMDYQKIDSIQLFGCAEKRIPKDDKTDLEGSTILKIDDVNHLLIVGSASRKNRKRIILIPFLSADMNLNIQRSSFHSTKVFIKRVQSQGIEEVNMEGVCAVKELLILGNRGNRSSQNNHLIITEHNFWEHQNDAKLVIQKLLIPATHNNDIVGLSELCYIQAMDMLLITLTSEAIDNAYDDGAIGDSYLGWINEASVKLKDHELKIDGVINLADVNPVFKKEKIEGICTESVTPSEVMLHLISDNDAGETRLFKIKLSFVINQTCAN